jgi:tetratricopeptide (TPR) repeat protein
MRNLTALIAAALMAALTALPASADEPSLDSQILTIQHQWAHINYQLPEDKKEQAFVELEKQAETLAGHYPKRAEPLLWQAIVLSTEAGVHGGLGALSMVDKARKLLEQAEKLNPDVMDGSIYTSLGSLYYQVPGWPLSFGDDDKAQAFLEQALQLNPDGIDPNYFYGDFLYRDGQKDAALIALKKALQAPSRPNRPLADEGRRKEVQALIDKINHNG